MAQVLFREGLEPGISKIPRCKRRGGSTSDDRGWPVSLYSTACQQENTAERSDSFSYGIHRAFLLAKKAEIQSSQESVMPDIYLPAKTTPGSSFNTGRALIAAATMLTSMTITTAIIGVNHIMRNG
jgi:hypothetical protein